MFSGKKYATKPSIKLELTSEKVASGLRLSGVVILHTSKPLNIRTLAVYLVGREIPAGASITHSIQKSGIFFERECLLSGESRPHLTLERISKYWRGIMGRDKGRRLAAGEHIYPFSITLPSSLPSSYEGKAGRIEYTVNARARFVTGAWIQTLRQVELISIPRAFRGRPVALSYPTAGGTVHSTDIRVDLELPQRSVQLGTYVNGKLRITNPQKIEIRRVVAFLEVAEWVRRTSQRDMHRNEVDSWSVCPTNPAAEEMEFDFRLFVSNNAPPTTQGTDISVMWLLKFKLETEPLLELKTPIVIYRPLHE